MLAQKLHCSQNEVQIYKLGTQSPSQSDCNLPTSVLFHYKHVLKPKWTIYVLTQMPHTLQSLAFVYEVPPPRLPPHVVQRARNLKSIEFKAWSKYFQVT